MANEETHTPKLTKEDVLRILKEENPQIDKNYTQYMLIIEYKRLNENTGIIKGELYKNDVIELRGSILIPNPIGDPWENLKPGESQFRGFTLDTKEESFGELIAGFFKRTLKEGKLQDFIPK